MAKKKETLEELYARSSELSIRASEASIRASEASIRSSERSTMSRRDLFTMAALTGLLTDPGATRVAENAVRFADATIAALDISTRYIPKTGKNKEGGK